MARAGHGALRVRYTLARRPELEQRAGASCGGGFRGGGLSQGLGALLLKVKVEVSRTQPPPRRGQGSGHRAAEGSLGRGPRGDRRLAPACPLQKGEGALSTGAGSLQAEASCPAIAAGGGVQVTPPQAQLEAPGPPPLLLCPSHPRRPDLPSPSSFPGA